MAKTSYPQEPRLADLPPALVRLANRITLLTMLAAFSTVSGLALLPKAFVEGPVLLRAAATLPMLVAMGTILYVVRLRSELRRARSAG